MIPEILFALSMLGAVATAEPYRMTQIVLLQPDAVIGRRVEVQALSDYVRQVNAAAQAHLAGVAGPAPAAGFVVIAVRPEARSRVWLDFDPPLPPDVAAALRASLERVTPFDAKDGMVVFAISATLWGAATTERSLPSLPEWDAALKDTQVPLETEALVERVWPSEPDR